MRLYDFSAYAKKRDAAREAEQVRALVPHLNEPGAVVELKRRVEGWLVLHQAVDQVLSAKG
jgi:hypothetical protein